MTVLASYNDRIALGIDSIERAIVYSLLLLRYAIKQNITQSQQSENPYKDAIKIGYQSKKVDQSLEYRFIAEAKIPFQSSNSLLAGWDVFENVAEFTGLNPNPFATVTPATPNIIQAMPVEPDWVDTLEKFLTWASVVLSATTYPETEFVKVQVLEEANYPQIYFQYSLPFDHPAYALSGNILLAIQKIVSAYVDEIGDLQAPGVLPASRQFYKDPVGSIVQLQAVDVSNLSLGTMVVVINESSPYVLSAWDNPPTTDYRFVIPNIVDGSKTWVRIWTDPIYDPDLDGTIAGGSGGGNGVVNWGSIVGKPDIQMLIPQLAPVKSVNGRTGDVIVTGSEIRDSLASLTGDNRLDALAIKNLPSGGSGSGYSTPEQVRDSLISLTGDNRIDAAVIKNLPSGGSGSGYSTPQQVRDSLASLTGDNRLDAAVIKNIPSPTSISARELVNSTREYFVDLVNGNNSNTGLSVNSPITLQKAFDLAGMLDIGINNCIINVANQTSDTAALIDSPIKVRCPITSGGKLILRGNTSNPSNCKLNLNFNGNLIEVIDQGNRTLLIEGFKLQCAANKGGTIAKFLYIDSSTLELNAIDFGRNNLDAPNNQAHIAAFNNSLVRIVGNYTISGGNMYCHIWLRNNSIFVHPNQTQFTATLSNNPSFTSFLFVELHSRYTPFYTLLNFNGNATGKRYELDTLSIIRFTNGNESFFPGNQAGTKANGGVYL